jgi:Membrane protein involved in colicin uptake
MQIYNALDLKSGKKADYNKMGTLTQPVQFISEKEKDEEWRSWNLDWLEFQGMKQLRRNARRLMKNYKLAKGIIDKADYIVEEDNEMADLIDTLTKEDESALELKFYPIIPNVINVLCNEFSKRSSRIMFKAMDDISHNEMMEEKRGMVEKVLLEDAERKMMMEMMAMGIELDSEEMQKALAPESLQQLPEIEGFFRKDYKSMIEQWASHQMSVDEERFKLQELEERGFKDMLITDREFWHFKMNEDDYELELWNPLLTFYHKSPDVRYISQGNWVGKMDMMSVSDVIDKYGWMMNEEQMESLEAIYPVRSAGYAVQGYQNDGTYYDPTKSHDWNTEMPSLGYRQYTSLYDTKFGTGDIVEWILSDSEDTVDFGKTHLLRVSTIYWKSQRKIGHLTKITEEGEIIQDIITEEYKVTDKPLYNTSIYKQKSKDNLIFGEHIDWIWINETWGGVKIGPNRPAFWGMNNPGGINPIYLGLNGGKPGRVPFQFKGDATLYGCKLPVEGSVFGDRNTRSISLVDLMKPYQIGYNIVNNQIADILVDELGTVIMLDQNSLPRHSMGEDWGKNNLAKAYVAMKNFQMLPLDTSITNTENALNFQHYQVLNLEQTNRLLSRVNLASYFKNQAFEVIGLNPQRMGQAIAQQTATGIEQAMSASYAQTEQYFIQHSDNLMPRVHQMRTDLAQYYHSNKPSVRLQYITSKDEKVNFEINGTELLMRDLNIFCTTKTNSRAVMEQLKQLAINNNTTGASIYDLGNVIKSESIAELTGVLKNAEQKVQSQKESEMQQQQEMQKQMIESQEKQKAMDLQFRSEQADMDRQTQLTVAEIRAAGYGATVDINQNQVSDYQDALEGIRQEQRYQDQMNLKRESEMTKKEQGNQKLQIERESLQARKEIADKQLQVAKENKNKYDVSKSSDKKTK